MRRPPLEKRAGALTAKPRRPDTHDHAAHSHDPQSARCPRPSPGTHPHDPKTHADGTDDIKSNWRLNGSPEVEQALGSDNSKDTDSKRDGADYPYENPHARPQPPNGLTLSSARKRVR